MKPQNGDPTLSLSGLNYKYASPDPHRPVSLNGPPNQEKRQFNSKKQDFYNQNNNTSPAMVSSTPKSRNFRMQAIYGQPQPEAPRNPTGKPNGAPGPTSFITPQHTGSSLKFQSPNPRFGYRSGMSSSSSSISSMASQNSMPVANPGSPRTFANMDPPPTVSVGSSRSSSNANPTSAPNSRQTSIYLPKPKAPPQVSVHNLEQLALNRSVPNLASDTSKKKFHHKHTDSYHAQLNKDPKPLTIHSLASEENVVSMELPKMPSSQTDASHHRRSPKFQRVLSSLSDRISSRTSSRTGTPNLMSRLSSRLSSRVGTPGSVKSVASSRSVATSEPIPDPVEDTWEDFIPSVYPPRSTVEEITRLCRATGNMTNIDLSASNSPLPYTQADLNDPEKRAFFGRGIYMDSEANNNGALGPARVGRTDSEGQYQEVIGEPLGFRYEVKGRLGVGSFGSVLKCRDHKTGRLVAVKVTTAVPHLKGQTRLEAGILRSLMVKHQGNPDTNHFIRYIEHFEFKGHLCIASELLGPNLYEVLKLNKHRGLSENTVKYISLQLCKGLDFLSQCGIIHCDLKPENILISDFSNCQVKIIDFGSGCYEGKKMFTYIQSRFYRSPEVIMGMPYGLSIDMWSLGAVLVELFLGTPLFPSSDEMDQVALICQVLGVPPPDVLRRSSRAHLFLYPANGHPIRLMNGNSVVRKPPGSTPLHFLMQNFSPDAIGFCLGILNWIPERRFTPKQALSHTFVKSVGIGEEPSFLS